MRKIPYRGTYSELLSLVRTRKGQEERGKGKNVSAFYLNHFNHWCRLTARLRFVGDNVVFLFLSEDRWSKLRLTYRFLKFTPDLSEQTVRKVFKQAFEVTSAPVVLSRYGGSNSKKNLRIYVSFFSNL